MKYLDKGWQQIKDSINLGVGTKTLMSVLIDAAFTVFSNRVSKTTEKFDLSVGV